MPLIRAITISGEVASGKSSLASAAISLLPGWKRINTGQRFREFCEERGISIQQVSYLPEEVHKAFDTDQRDILETQSHIVLEARLAGWIARGLEDVFKVFCYAPLEVRAERYVEREGVLKEKALEDIEYRDIRDVEKYKRMYNVQDYRDASFYDLRVDTSRNTPVELAKTIVERIHVIS
ncbi:MAG: AAA family ATPase [Ktedonobacteraceae bacterium]